MSFKGREYNPILDALERRQSRGLEKEYEDLELAGRNYVLSQRAVWITCTVLFAFSVIFGLCVLYWCLFSRGRRTSSQTVPMPTGINLPANVPIGGPGNQIPNSYPQYQQPQQAPWNQAPAPRPMSTPTPAWSPPVPASRPMSAPAPALAPRPPPPPSSPPAPPPQPPPSSPPVVIAGDGPVKASSGSGLINTSSASGPIQQKKNSS